MSFLTAEWRKLALANYVVEDDLLQEYVPYKTELDKWNGKRIVEYDWLCKGEKQTFLVESALEPTPIMEGSEEEFITEHYWGYTQVGKQKTYEYEVTHPRWNCYSVKRAEIEVDFGLVYGKAFSGLNDMAPSSVMLAEGSKITVEQFNVVK